MIDIIKKSLTERLQASYCEVADESSLHAGHAASKAHGGGHYRVVIVSGLFQNISLIERHRRVNEIVFEEFPGSIHALAVKAYSEQEWSLRKPSS